MKTVYANLDYVVGHLRYGHLEMNLDAEEYKKYQKMSDEDKKEWFLESGHLEIDDYEVDGLGDIWEMTA